MPRLALPILIASATALAVACSSSKGGGSSDTAASQPVTSQTSVAGPSTSTSGSSAPPTSAAAAAGLSGTWTGSYSGAFKGTFKLVWMQSGSVLTGTITLSNSGTVPIHGTISGGHINFGTVGSSAVTYTGSASGNSMSGKYQVAAGAGGSGTWTASKM